MDIVIVTHKDQQSIRVFAKEIYTECDYFDEKKNLKAIGQLLRSLPECRTKSDFQ